MNLKFQTIALAAALLGGLAACPATFPAEPGCGQSLVDGTTPPPTGGFILPRAPVTPFYQWENNDGYCGEVSLMEAGLANGQWASQFHTRLLCGTGLSQSGVDGACAEHRRVNYNAQLLIEDPGTGVTGPGRYAAAAGCAQNARLSVTTYPYSGSPTGLAGYRRYMSWVKAQVIAGNQVTVAVLLNGGTDPQYDHEVAVLKIGTNHALDDARYYDDDVLYFDDHGAYTLEGHSWGKNPAIPPGAGSDRKGCTPYVYGYGFGSLANTRAGANTPSAQAYSIVIPDTAPIEVYTGGDGYHPLTIDGPNNYAFSVSGPRDDSGETLPVTLQIVGPTTTAGVPNPRDPIAGYDYENPMIGASPLGRSCANTPPAPWMRDFTLRATVGGLTPGVGYHVYEYDFDTVKGIGADAALAVPTGDFNANAAMATHVVSFTATGAQFVETIKTRSDKIVVLRAVRDDAP